MDISENCAQYHSLRVSSHRTPISCQNSTVLNNNDEKRGITKCTMHSNTDVNGMKNSIFINEINAIREKYPSRIIVTLNGNAYDVTEFAQRHPGGKDLLEKHNGSDVEAVMQDAGSHTHSNVAYSILNKCRIPLIQDSKDQCTAFQKTQETVSVKHSPTFDGYVDWSQPLIGQVEDLGEHYYEWTHQQVDRPIRLFKSDIAEMMTKSKWWMVPITWLPVVCCSLVVSFRQLSEQSEVWPVKNIFARQYGPASIPLLLAAGILFWTLLEYVIHRWLFHLRPPPSCRFLIRLHFSLHGQHHKSPMDPMRLVFPPLPAAFFALVFYMVTHAMFPTGMAHSLFAGIVSGYIAYDLTHYYVHHGGRPPFAYMRRLKRYHTQHHYQHQQLGFGISSKLWDYPFGTTIPEDLINKKKQ